MKKAFTLIEIMVVVGIIAILAAMAIGPFAKAKDKTKDEECHHNCKILEMSFTTYNSDHPGNQIPDDVQYLGEWKEEIVEYIRGDQYPMCNGGGHYFIKGGNIYCSEHGDKMGLDPDGNPAGGDDTEE